MLSAAMNMGRGTLISEYSIHDAVFSHLIIGHAEFACNEHLHLGQNSLGFVADAGHFRISVS